MNNVIRFEFDHLLDELAVERDAKIFEAGDYPDKGISITEEDLDTIVGNFAEVPIKIEHVDSPLDPLGVVKSVWRRGRELFARLAFPKDLAAFLERRRIKKLSVALSRDPLSIAEVSLVLNPRVSSAAMFGFRTYSDVAFEGGKPKQSDKGVRTVSDSEKDRQIRELKFALRAKEVEARLAEFKSQGKIVPASELYAREILLRGDEKINFGEDAFSIAEIFERFLEAQPKVVDFSELAPAVQHSSSQLPDEEEVFAKLGVTREQVEKYQAKLPL
jgi:hypothetical protein